MERTYTKGEVQSLCHRLSLCNFAASKLESLLKSEQSIAGKEPDPPTFEDIQFSFYAETLIFHLGAFISFFYKQDPDILKRLHSSTEQLKKLHELRSVPAHVLEFEESMDLFDSYLSVAGKFPLKEDFEIIRDFIIGMVAEKSEKEAEYLRNELEKTRQRLVNS